MSTMIKRTTLKVRDMEKSIAFYEGVLSMSKYYDNEITLGGDLLPGGNKGDVTRLVIMKGDDPVIGMIGLLEWLSPKPEPREIPYDFDFGNPVFVAAVDDAEEAYAKAQALECVIRAPLSEAEYPGADGGVVKVRSVGVFDPDGHFFELNQRLEG